MVRKISVSVVLFISLIFGAFFFIQPQKVSAAQGINAKINFQGKVVNKTDGTNVTNGTYAMTFRIYDASSGGTQKFSQAFGSVTVTDGIFQVTLTGLPSSADFNTDSLWLDITFNGETMGSRIELTASPYAFNAQRVNGLYVQNGSGNPFSAATVLTIGDGKSVAINNSITFNGTDGTSFAFPSLGTGATVVTQDGTQTLTNKTIGSTGLTFSGAATDITTGTNENFSIVPNGSGKVGIGTTTPGSKLSIAGGVAIGTTAAGSTFHSGTAPDGGVIIEGAVGIGTANPFSGVMLDISGSLRLGATGSAANSSTLCLGTNNIISGCTGGGGGITGTGANTSNYLTKWVSAGSTVTNSLIIDTGTNVGISVTTPNSKLSIGGNFSVGVANTGVAAPANGALIQGSVGIGVTALISSNKFAIAGGVAIGTTSATSGYLNSGTAPDGGLIIEGAVGIGTTNPTQKLDVIGSILASISHLGPLFSGNGTGVSFGITGQQTIISGSNFTNGGLLYGLGTGVSTTGALSGIIQGNGAAAPTAITGTANYIVKWGSSAPYLTSTSLLFDNGTNLGIGTTIQGSKLSIAGNLAVGLGYTAVAAPTNGALIQGNVGIGTTATPSTLTVGGNLSLGAGYTGTAAPTNGFIVQGNAGFGANNPQDAVNVNGSVSIGSTYANPLPLTNMLTVSGRLGIGTSNPSQALDVQGNVTISTGSTYGGAGVVNITSGSASALNIDSGTTGTINIGATGSNSKTINIGNTAASTTITLMKGASGNIQLVGFNCAALGNGGKLTTDSSGNVSCAADTSGSGGGGNTVSLGGNAGIGDTLPVGSGATAAIHVNVLGTAPQLLKLQQGSTDKFVVGNNGAVTISTATNNVTRTSNSDFLLGTTSPGGSLVYNNGQIEMSDGTPSNNYGTIGSTNPTSAPTIGSGSHAIIRANGKYLIINGGVTTGTSVYDAFTNTYTTGPTLTAVAGAGALSLPRNDGRYELIHGNTSSVRNVISPDGLVAPAADAGAGFCATAGAGTTAFRRANGRYLVTCGSTAAPSTSTLFDPAGGGWTTGPTAPAGVVYGAGALVLPRPDGQAVIVNGGSVGTTTLYDPFNGAAAIGSMGVGPTMGTGCEINGAGSVALRRQDGKYVVLSKANASTVYDPVNNIFTCRTSNGPSVALADGAHAIPLQNNKFAVMIGSGSTAISFYDQAADTFTAGSSLSPVVQLTANGGAGMHSFIRQDGKWMVVLGGGTGHNIYDLSIPMFATYQSDDISSTALNPNSTLRWTAQMEQVYVGSTASTNTAFATLQTFVRTANGCGSIGAATDREIRYPLDYVRPAAVGDNCIRVTFKFNRPIPKRISDDRGTFMGNGSTVFRLDYATPTLFDFTLDNAAVIRRNSFEYSLPNTQVGSTDSSGPNFTRVNTQNGALVLPYGVGVGSTPFTNAAGTGLYPGAIGTGPTMPQATTEGTVVIARPNRTFLVIPATTTPSAAAYLYDPATSSFTSQGAGSTPSAVTGAGALALKRPDGKFLLAVGNTSSVTNIYDPSLNTFSVGPTAPGNVGSGAHAIPNTDGTFTILLGGGSTGSAVYDPVRNTMVAGPLSPVAISCGGVSIPRPNGLYMELFGVGLGVSTPIGTTSVYDSNMKVFTPTANSITLAGNYGCGAAAFQRPDGNWIIMEGQGGASGASITTAVVYNPVAHTSTISGLTFTAYGKGAVTIPRPDGTFHMINGNTANTTQVYIPWGGAFLAAGAPAGAVLSSATTGMPTTSATVGIGSVTFQRPDGKWVLIHGNSTNTTSIVDVGWVADGQYLSEEISTVSSLSANSTMEWKQGPDDYIRMEVRAANSITALGTASYTSVGRPGQTIGNAGGETYVQVEVNMRREFPTWCGSLADVFTSSGGNVWCNRYIPMPTLYEYKINNGVDLVNLQSDNENIFRVTSNGNVYTSKQGGVFTGGADLAENYTSSQKLLKGEVVTIDSTDNHNVKRAVSAYQRDLLGVVSTQPGFVAGAFTEDSYPIALVGRVPVLITTENGPIKVGDYITSSSLPGYAMKATMAGKVIGKALEDLDESKYAECPVDRGVIIPNVKCGSIMMFVNLTDYLGQPVEVAMADNPVSYAGGDGLTPDNVTVALSPELFGTDSARINIGETTQEQEKILSFLRTLNTKRASGSGALSQVFTDRVVAAKDVISPHIITDLLTAKRIKAESIEGLELYTDKIDSLSQKYQQLSDKSATPSANGFFGGSAPKILGSVSLQSGDVLGTFNVKGEMSSQGLTVLGPAQFKNETLFDKVVNFISGVVFKDTVTFLGRPIFNKDTAGYAKIKEGMRYVDVNFEKEYDDQPVVNASIILPMLSQEDYQQKVVEGVCNIQTGREKCHEKLVNNILTGNVRFVIINKGKQGFIILLDKPAPVGMVFSWTATAVKDVKTYESKEDELNYSLISPSPIPSSTSITPTPTSSLPVLGIPDPLATSSSQLNN